MFAAGWADYSWLAVTAHRTQAYRAAATLTGRRAIVGRGQVFGAEDYFRLMHESRIVLSPLGYGEMNWKDFEAVLAGAVIVKPDVSHAKLALFDLYAPGGDGTVSCAMDFSNLPQVVENVMDELDLHDARTRALRRSLLDCFDRDLLTDQFSMMITDAMG